MPKVELPKVMDLMSNFFLKKMGLKSIDSLMQEACITSHQEEKQCQQSPVEKKIYNRMNSKQTAVEWLYGKSKLRELDKFDLEQAKEMEREQIESAFTHGELFSADYFDVDKPNEDCNKNYYNQTFK